MRPTPIRPSRIEDQAFMSSTSFHRPFFRMTLLAVVAIAAPLSLTPMANAQAAQSTQQAALSDGTQSDGAKVSAPQISANDAQPIDQSDPSQPKSITTKAIEKVK